jgi:hypothetical protein
MIFGAAISSMAPTNEGQTFGGVSSVVVGLVMMIFFPIMYGLFGFVGGAIGAAIYNIAAGIVGGIKF